MAEKIINTRIALKIDTLENWKSSTIGLKKGELAIATVASSAGTGLTEPVVMIKVGEDGVKTFNQLPWNMYAKASDVLTACKDENALKAFVNGVIADAGIATNAAMEALADRVTTAESDIDKLEGLVGSKAVATQITEAIAALKLADTYDAKGAAATALEDAKEYTDGVANDKVDKVTGKSLIADTEITRLAGMSDGANKVEKSTTNGNIKIDGTETVVYTHPDKHTISEITDLQITVDKASANETAIGVLNGNSSVAGSVNKKIADAINEFATQMSDDNTVNTYKELINYAATHGAEFTELVGEVDANTGAIATLNGDANTVGSVDKKIADAVSGLATIAKTGNINDLVQTDGDVLVFNCGTATTVI